MIQIFTSHNWIILLATLALIGIGVIQMNWIYQGYLLKQEEINLRLKETTPRIAKILKPKNFIRLNEISKNEEPIRSDSIDWIIESIMEEEGFSEFYYSFFQNKKQGTYESNSNQFEKELRQSKYKTCIDCIITFHVFNGTEEDLADQLNGEGRPELYERSNIRGEMTTIRSVENTLKLDSNKNLENILWFSIYVPNQFNLAFKAILIQIILIVLLMGLLIGLFIYTLRTLARQKKLSQVKDDFFNNMTHEFKTPLSSIRLASKVLQQNIDENKKIVYLDLIHNESKKLEGQVDKILQLSLLESNQMVLEKETMDIHRAIQEVTQRLKLIIEQKHATVDLSLNLKDSFIIGDYAHFSNCIYNLVENALKYSGENPKISVSTFEKNNKKNISIKDKGKGIAEEHRAEIFDRFFRAQKNDQYQGKGFGIGLSYVKAILEGHGGEIVLNKNYKDGCEFIVMMP